jgi:hypothetical protein
MSFLYFGNVPASVPPVFDTTPCMKEMLQYEDCIFELLFSYSVQTYHKKKYSIQIGQQCGLAYSLTEKLLS